MLSKLYVIALFMIMFPRAGLCEGPKAAESDTLFQYRMEEIVVTAGRIASPLEDVPLSVSFIGREDIEISLRNSSTDLAGSLPGVFIGRPTRMWSIFPSKAILTILVIIFGLCRQRINTM